MLSDNMKNILRKAIPLPQRVILALMGFFAVINAYTLRVCLSVAITDIVIKKYHNDTINEDEGLYCALPESHISDPNTRGKYEWDEELQGLILSSFYWGYVVTHVPGGVLAERYGGKWVLSIGILCTAILTLLTPLAIDNGGAAGLMAVRILEGLGEGTTMPACSALLAMWIPLSERSKLGALVFGGSQLGTIFGNSLSGLLIDYYDDWRACFYFFGFAAILWFIFFTILCYSDPESHPYISDKEKEYLKKEIGHLERDKNLTRTPWKLILTNLPMISLVICQIGHDFGFFAMVTDLPKYMSDVLHFKIKENGIYSSLPYVLMWIVTISAGFFSDWLIKNKHISLTNSRKLFTTLASAGPAIFMVAASYAGCDRTAVVILFTVAMGTMGNYYSGMKVNPLDLSPNYAGTLMAITNGVAAMTGMVGPWIVGKLTPNSSLVEWRLVFWLAFIIFMITNLVYLIWASAEVQPFNSIYLNKTDEIETGKSGKNTSTNKK